MTFDEFKGLLEFKEETDNARHTHHFRAQLRAQLRAQAEKVIASGIFEMDQEGIRAYMHNELAHMVWDLCMQVFGPTYTVDDLRTAYLHGMYRCCDPEKGFELVLKEINRRKGQS